MNQTKYNDSIYVLVNEAYKIQTDETINNIYIPEDAYDDFVALNPTLNLTKINYRTFRVTKYPFVAFFRYENPEFFDLCKQQGWVERDDFMTLEECAAVTDEQMAQIAGTKASNYVSKAKDCKSLEQLQYFTGLTKIPADCFEYCKLVTKVVLPPNITSIEEYGFRNTGIKSIKFPKSLTTLGSNAFYDVPLDSIHITENITSIGDWPFNLYTKPNTYKKITVDKKNPVYNDGYGSNCIIKTSTNELIVGCNNTNIPKNVKKIINGAFSYCTFSTITLPYGLQVIGKSAFYNCRNLQSIIIPPTVTTIGELSFYNCWKLKSIHIPSSVTSIQVNSFSECRDLANITVDTNNTKYDSRNNCNAIIVKSSNQLFRGGINTVIPNSVTSIGDYSFVGSKIETIHIPSGITSIANNSFTDCDNLKVMTVDENNTKYDSRDNCNAIIIKSSNQLFKGCQNTVIPNSVTSIGQGAFIDCDNLTSITIPSSVTSIGIGAFSMCRNLTSVTIKSSTPPTLGNYAFNGIGNNITIYVPNDSVDAYKAATNWATYASKIIGY